MSSILANASLAVILGIAFGVWDVEPGSDHRQVFVRQVRNEHVTGGMRQHELRL